MALTTYTKRPVERRTYVFSFADFPEIQAGDTLDGTEVLAVLPDPANPPGLVVEPPVISAEEPALVLAEVSGGEDGQFFLLTCACSTARGAILGCVGRLKLSTYKD